MTRLIRMKRYSPREGYKSRRFGYTDPKTGKGYRFEAGVSDELEGACESPSYEVPDQVAEYLLSERQDQNQRLYKFEEVKAVAEAPAPAPEVIAPVVEPEAVAMRPATLDDKPPESPPAKPIEKPPVSKATKTKKAKATKKRAVRGRPKKG